MCLPEQHVVLTSQSRNRLDANLTSEGFVGLAVIHKPHINKYRNQLNYMQMKGINSPVLKIS